MKKRIASILLCLVMVLSLLPVPAYADTTMVRKVLAENGITYDDTAYSLACINATSAVSDALKGQSYYIPEMEDFVSDISIPISVWINGKMLGERVGKTWVSEKYYLLSSDGSSCEEKNFRFDINHSHTMAYTEGNGHIIAFLIPKSASYFMIPYYGAEPYTFMNDPLVSREYSMFNGSSMHEGTTMGYRGVADSGDMEFEFEMEWNTGCSLIKIEPFVYNPVSNMVDMTSYTYEGKLNVTYYVELRDPATGKIFPLPREWYHNIGYSSYDPDVTLQANILMREDGMLDMISEEWVMIDGHYYGCTGEIDLYIPYGYEFRISVYDSNIYQDGKALYGDSLQYSWRGEPKGDGFYQITEPYNGRFEGWVQVLFAPLTEEIRVEKKVEGDDGGASYTFSAERTVYELSEDYFTFTPEKNNYRLPLRNYLYRLFDAATDSEIDPTTTHRTDANGNFALKNGQYALFKTYTLPDDLPSVPNDGANMCFIDEYDRWTDTEKIRDVYSFEEITTGNFVTSIDHVTNGVTVSIDGRRAEEVYGTDELYFKNVMKDSVGGDLTVSKTVSGSAADSDKAFSFTVTLDDPSVNGTYGDMSFTNGTAAFTLKDGESKTATGLTAGTGFTVTEADYSADGYVTTGSGDTGTIADGKTETAAFINTKDAETPTPTPTPVPTPTPEPDDPTIPKTGDTFDLALWVMLLAAGAAGSMGTNVWNRKRRKAN